MNAPRIQTGNRARSSLVASTPVQPASKSKPSPANPITAEACDHSSRALASSYVDVYADTIPGGSRSSDPVMAQILGCAPIGLASNKFVWPTGIWRFTNHQLQSMYFGQLWNGLTTPDKACICKSLATDY